MLDFDDLYERLVKNSGITGFINKKDIINKTKLHHYHHYKPNKNTKEFDYMALVMKSCIMNNYKNTQYRIKKINKDIVLKFGNRNNFNQKIDELNQETETLIGEIEKWQT